LPGEGCGLPVEGAGLTAVLPVLGRVDTGGGEGSEPGRGRGEGEDDVRGVGDEEGVD
jgi:hypothetical protein